MIEENGVVVSVQKGSFLVQTQRTSTCGSCSAKAGCGTGLLSKWLNRNQKTVRVLNSADTPLKVGDEVVIGVAEHALVTGSFAVYVLPLIFIFLLTAVADNFASHSEGVGEGFVISVAFSAIVLSLLGIRFFSRAIRNDPRYQPVFIRKVIQINNALTASLAVENT